MFYRAKRSQSCSLVWAWTRVHFFSCTPRCWSMGVRWCRCVCVVVGEAWWWHLFACSFFVRFSSCRTKKTVVETTKIGANTFGYCQTERKMSDLYLLGRPSRQRSLVLLRRKTSVCGRWLGSYVDFTSAGTVYALGSGVYGQGLSSMVQIAGIGRVEVVATGTQVSHGTRVTNVVNVCRCDGWGFDSVTMDFFDIDFFVLIDSCQCQCNPPLPIFRPIAKAQRTIDEKLTIDFRCKINTAKKKTIRSSIFCWSTNKRVFMRCVLHWYVKVILLKEKQ